MLDLANGLQFKTGNVMLQTSVELAVRRLWYLLPIRSSDPWSKNEQIMTIESSRADLGIAAFCFQMIGEFVCSTVDLKFTIYQY